MQNENVSRDRAGFFTVHIIIEKKEPLPIRFLTITFYIQTLAAVSLSEWQIEGWL